MEQLLWLGIYILIGFIFVHIIQCVSDNKFTSDYPYFVFIILIWPVFAIGGLILAIIDFFTGIGGGHGGLYA